MKKFALVLNILLLVSGLTSFAQEDKSKRPSPPQTVKEKLASGGNLTIDYSSPSIKGRTIGTDLEPMPGKVWRTGANEATVIEFDKDVTIEGKKLPAGKYAFFAIDNGAEWTLIFNKTWNQWGAFDYKENTDALRVNVKADKAPSFTEKLTYKVADGKVWLLWGDKAVSFTVA
jgi:hypothetical protein